MRRPWRRTSAGLLSLVAAGALLAACGSSGGQAVKKASILTTDAHSRTVHLLLVGDSNGSFGGFNFDGYGNGALRVSVPLGWTVNVTCKNAATLLAHSCAIVEQQLIGTSTPSLAFPGASSPNPVAGLPPGESITFTFFTSKAGRFRIACLVSGHELDGMWDWFIVTHGGVPSVHT